MFCQKQLHFECLWQSAFVRTATFVHVKHLVIRFFSFFLCFIVWDVCFNFMACRTASLTIFAKIAVMLKITVVHFSSIWTVYRFMSWCFLCAFFVFGHDFFHEQYQDLFHDAYIINIWFCYNSYLSTAQPFSYGSGFGPGSRSPVRLHWRIFHKVLNWLWCNLIWCWRPHILSKGWREFSDILATLMFVCIY